MTANTEAKIGMQPEEDPSLLAFQHALAVSWKGIGMLQDAARASLLVQPQTIFSADQQRLIDSPLDYHYTASVTGSSGRRNAQMTSYFLRYHSLYGSQEITFSSKSRMGEKSLTMTWKNNQLSLERRNVLEKDKKNYIRQVIRAIEDGYIQKKTFVDYQPLQDFLNNK